MYILAVALEDRAWHHEASYTPERARRPSTVALWRKIRTVEDPAWTRAYHAADPAERAFGGSIEIRLDDGGVVEASRAVADAHPNGAAPWTWPDYVGKFETLTRDSIAPEEGARFVALAERLPTLSAEEVRRLTPVLRPGVVETPQRGRGIFDWPG